VNDLSPPAEGKPEVGDQLEITVGPTMAAGGDAIGRGPDGRVVFVEGALPGETVEVDLTSVRRDFAKGRVAGVLIASPERVTAPCPHRRAGCGGCPWQEIVPAAQVGLKEGIVLDALRRIGRVEPDEIRPATALPTQGYRTTVHLAVDEEGRPGYRRRHESTALAVDSCLVAHPWIEEILAEARFPGHRTASLRVGTAGGERLAVLPRHGPRPRLEPGVEVVGPGGDAVVREDVGGRRWRVSARVFFQAGPVAAEAIAGAVLDAVGDAIGPGDTLVDAYAGVGVLGGIVASARGAGLIAVEQHGGAVADAAVNLADLDAEVVAAEVGRWDAVPAGLVVADPARPGLGRPGVAALAATGAPRLVLVSCDPASLGRDAVLLAAAGYRLGSIQLIDAFPHTAHVEVVSRFDR
jgi:23S rRNA (uracil1939-C5)-methyltransferase